MIKFVFWGCLTILLFAAGLAISQTVTPGTLSQTIPPGTTVPAIGTGTISGTVLDDKGRPIAAAIVSLTLESASTQASSPFRSIALTSKDGTFSANYIPSGQIHVCVQVPSSEYIDVCLWPLTQTTVTLASGQSVKLPPISMTKGILLPIRVLDPGNLLLSATPAQRQAKLTVGATSTHKILINAALTSQDALGLNYEVLVPFGLPITVHVSGTALAVTDSKGSPVPAAGANSPITVASGTTSLAPIVVSVSAFSATGHP